MLDFSSQYGSDSSISYTAHNIVGRCLFQKLNIQCWKVLTEIWLIKKELSILTIRLNQGTIQAEQVPVLRRLLSDLCHARLRTLVARLPKREGVATPLTLSPTFSTSRCKLHWHEVWARGLPFPDPRLRNLQPGRAGGRLGRRLQGLLAQVFIVAIVGKSDFASGILMKVFDESIFPNFPKYLSEIFSLNLSEDLFFFF